MALVSLYFYLKYITKPDVLNEMCQKPSAMKWVKSNLIFS